MEITHSYNEIGLEYQKARRGNPAFAEFMIQQAGFNSKDQQNPLTVVELGVGSGQQTEFVENEFSRRGLNRYRIFAYDKSCQFDDNGIGQLNILIERIGRGEISEKVIPVHLNFDGIPLPVESGSVDLTYMGHVLHHINAKKHLFFDIARITGKPGRLFILGVTIEDLRDHPLNEFFPEKFEYDSLRYPTEVQIKDLFESAGFSYEIPHVIGRNNIRAIDRDFLSSIENTTMDSVLKMIKDNDPPAFRSGVESVRKEVERAEISGKYRVYYTQSARIFWGIKR